MTHVSSIKAGKILRFALGGIVLLPGVARMAHAQEATAPTSSAPVSGESRAAASAASEQPEAAEPAPGEPEVAAAQGSTGPEAAAPTEAAAPAEAAEAEQPGAPEPSRTAEPAELAGPGEPELAPAASSPEPPAPAQLPYMKRYVPEANMWELGLFGGLMLPSGEHQLFAPNLPNTAQQPFKASGEVGLRVAYFPLTFLGVEAEAAAMPSEADDGTAAGLWAIRGHVIGQLPGRSITPFVLFGAGALGASSDAMGNDDDDALHFGLGVKAALDQHLSVRLDVRDTLTRRVGGGAGSAAHHPELLLGVTFVPRRRHPDADGDGFVDYRDSCPREPGEHAGCPAADLDRDGVPDDVDECPELAGIAPSGCPDMDGDQVLDRDDRCPTEAGPAPHGCPELEAPCAAKDTDGDGLTDERDECPGEAAQTANGCPLADQDGDGILDANDACVSEAETKNGFEDADGCPDELPAEVRKVTGVMQGIAFDFGSARIKKASEALLNDAASVLQMYPSLRVLVSGHTDDTGDHDRNVQLSQQRADSVKAHLVGQGVAAERIRALGLGPDKPLADNATAEGKAKNRRIEFQLIAE